MNNPFAAIDARLSNIEVLLIDIKHKPTDLEIPDSTPEVLDVGGVAELLKITPATVHDWKRKGMLPYRKKGDRTYFLKSEVIASLDKPEVRRTVNRKKINTL